jgi:hypothetical protein
MIGAYRSLTSLANATTTTRTAADLPISMGMPTIGGTPISTPTTPTPNKLGNTSNTTATSTVQPTINPASSVITTSSDIPDTEDAQAQFSTDVKDPELIFRMVIKGLVNKYGEQNLVLTFTYFHIINPLHYHLFHHCIP